MKTGVKIILGLAGAVTAFALFSSFKNDSKKAKDDEKPDAGTDAEKATVEQFDALSEKLKASSMFATATPAELIRMRSAFSSNLSSKDANSLMALLNKKTSEWKSSEKINYDYLMKKWKGTPTVVKVVAPAPVKETVITDVYIPETDKDYADKSAVLSKWYDHIKAQNKKRIIPRIVPSKNKFMERFLPWSIEDLNTYVGLVYEGEDNRDVKDMSIFTKLKKKYPASFKGNDVIYNNFSGNINLSNF